MKKAFVFAFEEGGKRAGLSYCKENNIIVLNKSTDFKYENIEAKDLKRNNFDLVFISIAFGYAHEQKLLDLVKRFNLAYEVMIDHFWNIEKRLDKILKLNYLPQKVIVRSKKCAERARGIGIPIELIEVYEFSMKEFGKFTSKKSKFLAFISEWQLGLNARNKGEYDEATEQEFENLLKMLLNFASLSRNIQVKPQVYICLHPNDAKDRYESVYQNFSKDLYQVGDLDSLRISRPKAMVGFNSAVLIEGIMNEIPVITLKKPNSLLHEYFSQIKVCEDSSQLFKFLDYLC